MITLYTFPARFGAPSSSPFAMKSEVQLKMMGLPYRRENGSLDQAPKGKLPYIDDDGTIVADSTFIRLHLETKYGIDLDAGFDDRERALAWSIERMVEDSLFWPMVHARWAMEENFQAGPARNFDHLPEPAQDMARRRQRGKVISYLDGQGVGRLSSEEIGVIARMGYRALSRLIGDKSFILGDRPCGADASIFGQIVSAMAPLFPSPVRDAASEHTNLARYADRMMSLYYPDFQPRSP